jgi:hypothetical protein
VIPAFNAFKIPDNISDDLASIFDPFGNAVHTALFSIWSAKMCWFPARARLASWRRRSRNTSAHVMWLSPTLTNIDWAGA